MARITIYRNSILASICSIFGTVLTLAGIIEMIQEKEIVVGIIIMAMGIGCMLLGSSISEKKRFKQIRKDLRSRNIESQIAVSTEIAFQVYNLMPGKRMLKYIRSLNPQAAVQIQKNIAKKKN